MSSCPFFPGPVPNCSEELGVLACLPLATPIARPVFPPSIIPPTRHGTHLPSRSLVTQSILLAVGLCMFLSLPFSVASPVMFSHALSPISLSTLLLPTLFYRIVSARGMLACASSPEALEGRARIFAYSRLWPSQSPPYRRASKAMGFE